MDSTTVIQVGSDNLTIHQITHYNGWENFKAQILKYLLIYYKIANPNTLVSVVLRYVW